MSDLDSQTIDAVYRRFFPLLRGKCRRMLRTNAEAEEVAQDAFVRLLQWSKGQARSFEDPRQVTAWLYRASTRLAIDRLRTRRVSEEASEPDTRSIPSAEGTLLARKTLERLARMVDDDVLQAAVLCRVDGLSHDEASVVLDCSERTVRRLLDRCGEALTKLTEEERS